MKNLTIIGLGLLGGSIGLAVKKSLSDCKIMGCAHRDRSLIEAETLGAIDQWTLDPAQAVSHADLVVLCMPVGQIPEWIKKIVPHLKPGAVVTDVGSTKSAICLAGKLIQSPATFVGSHPMAGSEKTGVAVARADLFNNAICIITPQPDTPTTATQTVEQFWQKLGCRVVQHSPEEHDRLVALVSHLPHAVAAAVVGVQTQDSIHLRGRGFTDTTRIAAGDAGLWRDIFIENRHNLVETIERLKEELSDLSQKLRDNNPAATEQWLADRAGKRKKCEE